MLVSVYSSNPKIFQLVLPNFYNDLCIDLEIPASGGGKLDKNPNMYSHFNTVLGSIFIFFSHFMPSSRENQFFLEYFCLTQKKIQIKLKNSNFSFLIRIPFLALHVKKSKNIEYE